MGITIAVAVVQAPPLAKAIGWGPRMAPHADRPLFPAVAASLAGMEAHREYLRLEKRSQNMAPQLERLYQQLKSARRPEKFVEIIHKLDELMLRESQDWLMLMRFVAIKAS